MATYWKLFLMLTLAGATVILSTAVVTLRFMYERKLQRLEHLKKKKKNKKTSTSPGKARNKKFGLHRTNSKTIRKSFPVDATTELLLHRTTSASTSNPRTAADAHLGQALRLIPFEKEGGKDGRGNALPPKLIHGEVGDGRGSAEERAKKSWDSWKRFGGGGYGSNYEPDAGGTFDARSHATTTTTAQRRKGGLIRRIRDALSSTPTTSAPTTNNFQTEREAVYHLEQAAELGHHYAQNVLANSLASGILPVPDAPGLRNQSSTPLHVTSDFTEGGEQLARALILWHLSAMDGNIESAMAMGYRHLYSAKTGHKRETVTDRGLLESLFTEDEQRTGTSKRRRLPSHDSSPSSHYGVLGTCESALAYYEAAADAVMDEVESSPMRGKVTPASDQHRLAEMYQRGTSSALSYNNKPDELDEALTYYKMRASTKNPQPDVHAAYKLATMYHYGLKGVKQDMAQALKYYEIAADHGSWEAAGQAGKFHLWGMGMEEEKRDLQKAYDYFEQASPGGLDGCQYRFNKNTQNKMKQAQDELDLDDDLSEISQCDHPAVNGMGLLHVFGVPKTVGVNVTLAHGYFILARDMGNMDAYYNLAMLHLGWMNPGYGETLTQPDFKPTNQNIPSYPSRKDFRTALSYLERAAKRGHWQAKYHLAKLHARGATITRPGSNRVEQAVQPSCSSALKLYKEVADGGTTVTGRMRTAFKQYTKGDYVSSLRNYIAAAETGSMDAQVNAAFLLEQGHCLGMDSLSCLRASLRMWKAAARQGNEEACLRVGDFYYYNRLENGTETSRADVFSIATSPYTRYLLYPEDLLQLASRSLTAAIKRLIGTSGSTRTESKSETSGVCDAKGDGDNTCSNTRSTAVKKDEIGKKRLAQAAEYYRLAAKEHGSERANFNLGIMHQHGLGLTQDFPLAKRHYDLAAAGNSGDGIFAVQIALTFMNLHESVLKLGMYLEKRLGEVADSDDSVVGPKDPNLVGSRHLRVVGVIISHLFSWETVIILILLFVLKKLLLRRQNRNLRG